MGIHNFYAGRTVPAIIQLILSFLAGGVFNIALMEDSLNLLSLAGALYSVLGILILIDIITVRKNGKGLDFC